MGPDTRRCKHLYNTSWFHAFKKPSNSENLAITRLGFAVIWNQNNSNSFNSGDKRKPSILKWRIRWSLCNRWKFLDGWRWWAAHPTFQNEKSWNMDERLERTLGFRSIVGIRSKKEHTSRKIPVGKSWFWF